MPGIEHSHSPEAIAARLDAGPSHSYLHDAVLGGIDGGVTTFAVVSGVVGAELNTGIILILGAANLLADGFSMAAGNYSATKAEQEQYEHLKAVEYRHVDTEPEGEREELRQIYERKGFSGADLAQIVDVLSSDRERWVQTMLTEEYGLPHEIRSPLTAAGSTMAAFMACGLVPLIPYLVGSERAFIHSLLATSLVFFAIGSAKSLFTVRRWWTSGMGTLLVGGGAAALAYAIGALLKDLVTV